MERQGPMTPVVREASGPDTGAPIAGSDVCAAALAQFKDAMAQFGVPLSPEKTIGPVPVITFLGIEIDSVAMEFRLPKEKIDKLLDLISGCIFGWIYWNGAFRSPWRRWIAHIRSGMSWGPDAINTFIDSSINLESLW
ncbi:unnamed protein product [Ranitomeya imitator]|uniref:Reverse transcriptase n=1 Tax=Ranitomeya imitator TaxID=111125 RepID=A0ABN9LZ00_9NEOB|nr:unnamed protein product [Ranitomeya imitator]